MHERLAVIVYTMLAEEAYFLTVALLQVSQGQTSKALGHLYPAPMVLVWAAYLSPFNTFLRAAEVKPRKESQQKDDFHIRPFFAGV